MRCLAKLIPASGLFSAVTAFPVEGYGAETTTTAHILSTSTNPGSPKNSTAPGKPTNGTLPQPELPDFNSIKATIDVDWVPCADRFLCTKLVVPLDYKDKSANTTTIAFIKLVGGDGSGPDVLINPG